MAIDIEKLKVVLEPWLKGHENSVDIITEIQSIDEELVVENDSLREDEIKVIEDRINAEWSEKYENTFYGGAIGPKSGQQTQEITGKEETKVILTVQDFLYKED